MMNRYQYDSVTWIDLNQPTEEEVGVVAKEFSIDAVVSHDLLTPTPKPKVEIGNGYLYTVLHFPVSKHTHMEDCSSQEIDFLVGKNFVITVRYEIVDALEQLAKEVEVKSIVTDGMDKRSGNLLFFIMLKELYESVENELGYLNDWMQGIEKKIFTGQEKDMVISLSHAIRVLLDFKKVIRTHTHLLPAIEISGKKIFGDEFEYQIDALQAEHGNISESIDSLMESVVEFRETNNSLLESKQNEVMKTLTLMAFITLPLSLIASIFSMNTWLPFVGQENDFFIVLIIMVVAVLTIFLAFKLRKWI
ncbi:MAG: CorA family divalent cation transporter [Patescibacteria group bacterium]|nr:CorA family divalent cation transporter [bacterium]MDZ4241151.1 CorA family divalent cation transporter [Patescibacteria group bacterium]